MTRSGFSDVFKLHRDSDDMSWLWIIRILSDSIFSEFIRFKIFYCYFSTFYAALSFACFWIEIGIFIGMSRLIPNLIIVSRVKYKTSAVRADLIDHSFVES